MNITCLFHQTAVPMCRDGQMDTIYLLISVCHKTSKESHPSTILISLKQDSMRLHPWHEIPIGSEAPDELNFVVEVPSQSTTKYELDPELGIMRINRIMQPSIPYPANYGFIPQTLDEDGDPLDALVLMQNRAQPLTVLSARPIGVANLSDRRKTDDKIICVHCDDPKYSDCQSIDGLADYEREEITWFFEDYKEVMQKDVNVKGLNGTKHAYESIRKCRERYQEKFPEGWDG